MINAKSPEGRLPVLELPATVRVEVPRARATPARPATKGSEFDRAYREYCRLLEAGAAPDPDEFVAGYPELQSSLELILALHDHQQKDPHFYDKPEVCWPQAGELFQGFRLERELGQGAFSHVFLASEPALGNRRVVVKISRLGAAEAQTLGRLAHANIGPVHSVVVDGASGLAVVCMPYLGEATLADLLQEMHENAGVPRQARAILDAARKSGTAAQAAHAEIASQSEALLSRASYADGVRFLAGRLLDALAFIHAQGVIHRDVKPSNVLLTYGGAPMLLDFNLSGDVRRSDIRFGGTPVYMGPEQLRAMGTADADSVVLDGRADLFSLGVILYELLTGEHPFGPPAPGTPFARMKRELLWRHEAGARPVRELNPAVDRSLAELVDRCLAFAPEARPASAELALAMLEPPTSIVQRIARRPRMCLAVLLTAALISVFSWSAWAPRAEIPLTEQHPAAAVTDLQRGQAAYSQGDNALALECLGRHLLTHSGDASAYFARGLVFSKLGEHDSSQFKFATADFREADRLVPTGRTKACLAHALHRNGQLKDARLYYEGAQAHGCATAEVLNNLGSIYLTKDPNYADAERCLTQALTLNDKLQAAYHNRARLYLNQAAMAPGAAAPRAGAIVAALSEQHLLELAWSDAVAAIDLGPVSGELFLDAAKVCVGLVRYDAAFVDRAISNLDQALRHGVDPKRINCSFFTGVFSEVEAFNALRNRSQIPSDALKARCVVAVEP